MPRRVVIIRRWEVVAAFLILVASFAAGLVQITRVASRTHALAVQNRAAIQQVRQLRKARIHDVQDTDRRLCHAINTVRQINNRDRDTLQRGLRQTRRELPHTQGLLHSLLAASVAQTVHEISIRPRLRLIDCEALATTRHLPP